MKAGDHPRRKQQGKGRQKKHHHSRDFRIGYQNVRTMTDRERAQAPPRRTAMIAAELEKVKADVVALTETRIPGEGETQEGSISIFWKGFDIGHEKQGTAGVGIALSQRATDLLMETPNRISPRLMTAKFSNKLYVIVGYAPTHQRPDTEKEKFYDELQKAIDATPTGYTLVISGDFNARVGKDSKTWEKVVGPHGHGDENEAGHKLL